MDIHYKIFLDTNIYDGSNYSFRNGLFSQLTQYAANGLLELQINTAVKREVCRHIKKRIKETAQSLNQILSSRDLQLFRTLPDYEKRLETSSPATWAEKALQEFEKLLKECKVEEISSNGIDVESVLEDYFDMRYPFENAKKDEFPDAIIMRSVAKEIERLSIGNLFCEYVDVDGFSDDLVYCIASDDGGFRKALKRIVGNRPNEDVKIFSSLNELVNYLVIQEENAASLQEKLNNGYAKETIVCTIEEGISNAAFTVEDPDGFVAYCSNKGTGDYRYDAYVIGVQEMSDGTTVARIYLEARFGVMLDYEFINETESYWDKEEQTYLWQVRTEKVANFMAEASMGFSMIINQQGEALFNDYLEMPSEIKVDYSDLVELISCESNDVPL